MDFQVQTFIRLIKSLREKGFLFQTFESYLKNPAEKLVILRHDVDKLPNNSLQFAIIQSEHAIKGSYYFRIMNKSFDPVIIQKISSLGHEIGYHYEDISFIMSRKMGKSNRQRYDNPEQLIIDEAIENFQRNLEKLREFTSIRTICMHGSPGSKWDNRLLWKYNNYRDFGIVGEPYFDLDFSTILYLTDTGRRWNGDRFNIRDKLQSYMDKVQEINKNKGIERMDDRKKGQLINGAKGYDLYGDWRVKPQINCALHMKQEAIDFQKQYTFRSTFDIIEASEAGRLPDKIMLTIHPQRWTNRPIPWMKELVWQNMKNVAKFWLIKARYTD